MAEENVYSTLLVVGSQRSGTTLVTSILGRHSEINMLTESFTKDVTKLIGKRYRGNKLLGWRQIRYSQSGNRFTHILNWLANIFMSNKRPQPFFRPFPNSSMSIEDYKKENTKFIVLRRNKEAVIKSMLKRAQLTEKRSLKEWDLCEALLVRLEKEGALTVHYEDLVAHPEPEIRKICDFLKLNFEKAMLDGPKFNFYYPDKNKGFVVQK